MTIPTWPIETSVVRGYILRGARVNSGPAWRSEGGQAEDELDEVATDGRAERHVAQDAEELVCKTLKSVSLDFKARRGSHR